MKMSSTSIQILAGNDISRNQPNQHINRRRKRVPDFYFHLAQFSPGEQDMAA
jgi:hypothetical protein